MPIDVVNAWIYEQPYPIDPFDVDEIPFDFTEYLTERGATIDSDVDAVAFEVSPDTLTEEGKNHDDYRSAGRFSGWQEGVKYTITCQVTAGAFSVSRSTAIECRKL